MLLPWYLATCMATSGYFETILSSVKILLQAIIEREFRARPPYIVAKSLLSGPGNLQFHRADEIYRQG
jgi:hypothetical protein